MFISNTQLNDELCKNLTDKDTASHFNKESSAFSKKGFVVWRLCSYPKQFTVHNSNSTYTNMVINHNHIVPMLWHSLRKCHKPIKELHHFLCWIIAKLVQISKCQLRINTFQLRSMQAAAGGRGHTCFVKPPIPTGV